MTVDIAVPAPASSANVAPDIAAGEIDFIDLLAERGWCVVDDFLAPIRVGELRASLLERWGNEEFRQAGVGRGEQRQLRTEVRTDHVRWLDPDSVSNAEAHYLGRMESLRGEVNRALFLGLFDFEAHLAMYPPGTFYRKHLDQFLGIGTRTLSAVLYLNEDWGPADGGQLRIYTDAANPDDYEEVEPLAGRLVLFLSARFLHEVMPARRERMSVTGWFRTRENGLG